LANKGGILFSSCLSVCPSVCKRDVTVPRYLHDITLRRREVRSSFSMLSDTVKGWWPVHLVATLLQTFHRMCRQKIWKICH